METISYFQFVLAFVFVIGLILGMAWLLRRFGLGEAVTNTLGRKKCTTIVESASVDGRHRLVLMRRDETEHLLLIGSGDSLVIERGIKGGAETGPAPDPA